MLQCGCAMKTYKAAVFVTSLILSYTFPAPVADVQSTVTVETCDDLIAAGEAASIQDTVALIDPGETTLATVTLRGSTELSVFYILGCEGNHTVRVENNKLTVKATDAVDLVSFRTLFRIEVAMSGHLQWEPRAYFSGDDETTVVRKNKQTMGYVLQSTRCSSARTCDTSKFHAVL